MAVFAVFVSTHDAIGILLQRSSSKIPQGGPIMRTVIFILVTLIVSSSLVWAESRRTPASHSAKTNGLLDLDIPDMVEVHVRPGKSVRHRSMVRGAHRILGTTQWD